jgi:hypothetical protein
MWSKIQAWLRRSSATPETSTFEPLSGTPVELENTTTFGLLSGSPAELDKTEFFRWFNLKPVQERRDDGGVAYAPAAENFRHRIALIFFRAPAGATRSIALKVDRSLLGERQFEASARDIIKSFLLAVAGSDASRVSALADEIQFGELQSPMVTRKTVNLPAQPSAALDILLGRSQDALSFDLQQATIWFDNLIEGGQPRFVICAYPRGTTGLSAMLAAGASVHKKAV